MLKILFVWSYFSVDVVFIVNVSVRFIMNFETLLLVLQTVWEEKIFVDWSGKGKPWARLNTSRPCQLDTLWSLYNLLQTLFDLDSDRFGRGKLNALPLQKKSTEEIDFQNIFFWLLLCRYMISKLTNNSTASSIMYKEKVRKAVITFFHRYFNQSIES